MDNFHFLSATELLRAYRAGVASPVDDPTDTFRVHFFAGIAHSTRLLSEVQLSKLDPDLGKVLKEARKVSLTEYMSAVDGRAALGRATRAFHEKYDLLLTPTVAVAPFEAGRLTPEAATTGPRGPHSPTPSTSPASRPRPCPPASYAASVPWGCRSSALYIKTTWSSGPHGLSSRRGRRPGTRNSEEARHVGVVQERA